MKRSPIRSIILLAALCPLSSIADDPPTSAAEQQLAALGVEASAESIGALFHSMLDDADLRDVFSTAVGNLGAADFRVREKATKWLLKAKTIHWDLLEKSAVSPDPETRFRAGSILELLRKNPPDKRLANTQRMAFRVIEERGIGDLAELLLQLMPKIGDPQLSKRAAKALLATAGEADADALRTALDGDRPAVQVAALAALEKVLGEQVAPDAERLLADRAETVRLAAARALADLGRREALPVLVDLLNAEQQSVRSHSAFILRGLSGQRFGFSPRAAEPERLAARATWSDWLAGEGATAALHFPVGGYTVDTEGLVLLLAFDGEGEQLADTSGSGNHGLLHNARRVAGGGLVGGGCAFDGKGDYVNVANSDSLEITEQLTLAAWIEFDSFGPGGYGNEEGHIIKKGNPMWWNPSYGLGYRKTSRRAKFVVGQLGKPGNHAGADLYSQAKMQPGRWHHLAGTYDGKVARLYIDGELDTEKAYAKKIRGDRAPVMLGGGKLGSLDGFANHFAIHGTVDEVRIYNRALAPDEVELLAEH